MKAEIKFERGAYGFGMYWSLVLTKRNGDTKSFYLGQDVKFCSRVLGMSPRYIVEKIGSGDITNPKVNTKLSNFVIKTLGINKSELFKLEPWAICAE